MHLPLHHKWNMNMFNMLISPYSNPCLCDTATCHVLFLVTHDFSHISLLCDLWRLDKWVFFNLYSVAQSNTLLIATHFWCQQVTSVTIRTSNVISCFICILKAVCHIHTHQFPNYRIVGRWFPRRRYYTLSSTQLTLKCWVISVHCWVKNGQTQQLVQKWT